MVNKRKRNHQSGPLKIDTSSFEAQLVPAPSWEDLTNLLIKPFPGLNGTSVSFGPIQTTKDLSERDADIAEYNSKAVAKNKKYAILNFDTYLPTYVYGADGATRDKSWEISDLFYDTYAKYLPEDKRELLAYKLGLGEKTDSVQNHYDQKALNQAQYEYALQGKTGLHSSFLPGYGAYASPERSALAVDQMIESRPEVKEALERQGVSALEFFDLVSDTYQQHDTHGAKVSEIAHKNALAKEDARKQNALNFQDYVSQSINNSGQVVLNLLDVPNEFVYGTIKDIKDGNIKNWANNRVNNIFGAGNLMHIDGAGVTHFTDVAGSSGNPYLDLAANTIMSPTTLLSIGKRIMSGKPTRYGQQTSFYKKSGGGSGQMRGTKYERVTQPGATLRQYLTESPSLGFGYPVEVIETPTTQTVKRASELAWSPTKRYLKDTVKSRKFVIEPTGGAGDNVVISPALGGSSTKAEYKPVAYSKESLPQFVETARYIKDWGNDDVIAAFRQAAKENRAIGEKIYGPSGRSYIYKFDPNFTGRITLINPNGLLAGGTNEPVVTYVANHPEIPEAVKRLKIPAGYNKVITEPYTVKNTPTYDIGTRTFKTGGNISYLNYKDLL